jgi:hypothetical protein
LTGEAIHDASNERGVLPVIPLKATGAVKKGLHLAPVCEHGEWTFGGVDRKRRAAQCRCPTKKCVPASKWRKASRLWPLIPPHSRRAEEVLGRRTVIEGEFGRLKLSFGLRRPPVRENDRVRQFVDLVFIARLGAALVEARAAPATA